MRALTVGNMYPPHHLGGYELVWRSAVEHLRARGHEATVLTTDHRERGVDGDDPPWVHRDLRWWWRDHAWPRFGLGARLRIEQHNAEVLARRLAEDRPDVVVWLAMGGMSLSLIERVRRLGVPAVGVVHDDWMVYGPLRDAWLSLWDSPRLARLGERWTKVPTSVDLSAAAEWLFVSDFVRRKALSAGGLELERTAVVHSGIDEAHLRPLAPPRPWGWHVLSVGRLDPRKGVDTAIRAVAAIPEARLSIAGGGDDREAARLRALAGELGVGDRVAFLGFRGGAELEELYAGADAVVFPVTWDEPWGLVPLEAMAHGVPVVATGRGGSAEYLRDGENALLFEAGDPAALAATLRRLAGDEGLRARLRRGGAETAPRHTDRAFNETLERVLSAAAGGA